MVDGIEHTGSVITSAAAIMLAVFCGFALACEACGTGNSEWLCKAGIFVAGKALRSRKAAGAGKTVEPYSKITDAAKHIDWETWFRDGARLAGVGIEYYTRATWEMETLRSHTGLL